MSAWWNNLESLQTWLSRAQWGLGIFGIITAFLTVAVIWIGDRVSDLQNARNTELSDTVKQLTQVTKPKSFKERLIACLESIDSAIVPALRNGTTQFRGDLKPWQFAEIQKLCSEPESSQFISVRVGSVHSFTDQGLLTPVEFELSPTLLEP